MLFTGKDFVIIDFEGEPERPVSERRIKASPLRDVAGMLRSFHYVAHAALRGKTPHTVRGEHGDRPDRTMGRVLVGLGLGLVPAKLSGRSASRADSCRSDRPQLRTLLSAYLLEKALYELRYELNNRPDWVNIPLEGILQLVN